MGRAGGAGVAGRRADPARGLSTRRCLRRDLSVHVEAHRAARRPRPRQRCAADRHHAGRVESEPGDPQGPASGAAVSSAGRGGGDPRRPRHLPARQPVSRRRGDRHSAQQRGAPVLPRGATAPAQLPAVLARHLVREAAHPADPDRGRALPDDATSPPPLRLGDAL